MKYKFSKTARKKIAFTLAEVLITLAIIGVVAAITIPSVIVNTNQMEFKTGLRKAVSVLNQAITLNKALTGESPYDNTDLYNYLQQYMTVMKNNIEVVIDSGTYYNYAFYTTDGMRFEVPQRNNGYTYPLYESDIEITSYMTINGRDTGCGSLGLAHNPDGTTTVPCFITVDVNGERKPSPSYSGAGSASSTLSPKGNGWVTYYSSQSSGHPYKYADANGRLLTDIFPIMITDQGAIPYGVVAQKAMYQAQK